MVGFIVLNYNTWNDSIKCIDSIIKSVKNIKYRVYLVDNASDEMAPESVLKYIYRFNTIKFIQSSVNNGYSAGNNLGLSEALRDACKHIMIVNSDVLFVDDTINKMIMYLDTHDDVGIVGPQIYNITGEFMPVYMLSKLTAIGKLKNILLHTCFRHFLKGFEKKFIRKKELEKPLQVFSVSGCCFLMSNKCARQIYPLDENTFLYEEEYILGIILERKNIKVNVIPDTHIVHAHGSSTKKISKSYDFFIESEQYYLKKYLNTNFILRYLILFIRKSKYIFSNI